MYQELNHIRLCITRCYVKRIITRQCAWDLLVWLGYRPGQAELILLLIDNIGKRKERKE